MAHAGTVNCCFLSHHFPIPPYLRPISPLPTGRTPTPTPRPTSSTRPPFHTPTPTSPFLHAQTTFTFSIPPNTHTSSIPTTTSSSNSAPGPTTHDHDHPSQKTPFGYTRKDVLLIGLGVTLLGIALKTGLEYVGVDPLQAGNVVQLVLVLGLTLGWISTYIFRVSNKEMTYAQQLRDYESKVMQKRLESLTEAELEALLEEVEEEKTR